jgi:hypothetical protein
LVNSKEVNFKDKNTVGMPAALGDFVKTIVWTNDD